VTSLLPSAGNGHVELLQFNVEKLEYIPKDAVVIADNSHVVVLSYNNCDEDNVDDAEEGPEGRAMGVEGDGFKYESNSEAKEGGVSITGDIGMTILIEFHKHENGHEIHECCVKLKGDGGRTDVVAGGQDSFNHQGTAHGVVETKLLGDAKVRTNFVW